MDINYSSIKSELAKYGNERKYYVYRLVDPRTFKTFYVGKGCGERVLQHAKDVKSLIASEEKKKNGEDKLSLKSQQIAEIISAGKEVIAIIHRRGLAEDEAFEVEAALMDAYSGLTNIQKGHDVDRSAISLDDLCKEATAEEYTEPEEDYIIIKTSCKAIEANGSLYEATRRCWKAKLENAQKYSYVFSVIDGIVQEVYKVQKWFQYPDDLDRIAFEGEPATDLMANFKGKRIPSEYRKEHSANPFLYKKKEKR